MVRKCSQSGKDQTRSIRSKQPDTMTSDEVSKSETKKGERISNINTLFFQNIGTSMSIENCEKQDTVTVI